MAFAAANILGDIGDYSLLAMIVTKWPAAILGLIVTVALRNVYLWLGTPDARLRELLIMTSAGSYAAGLVWTVAYNLYVDTTASRLLSLLAGEPARIIRDRPLLDHVVQNTVVVLSWSALYFGLKQYQALQTTREHAARAEAEMRKAELRALRLQLNPHFLFNTLNALSTLVIDGCNSEAVAVIGRLSRFLRLTLEQEESPEVALSEEVDFARSYLEIEQVRFGPRLQVSIDLPDDLRSCTVPALILQPLVENAIKHSIARSVGGGSLSIYAMRERNHLLLVVRNSGAAGRSITPPDGLGIGLSNISQRLAHVYGSAAALELSTAPDGGCQVTLRLPWRRQPFAASTDLRRA